MEKIKLKNYKIMEFRIKQLDEIVFIPQVKERLFSSWCGIDNTDKMIWITEKSQYNYCKVYSYEKALNRIKIWKANKNIEKPYPKYFKI